MLNRRLPPGEKGKAPFLGEMVFAPRRARLARKKAGFQHAIGFELIEQGIEHALLQVPDEANAV